MPGPPPESAAARGARSAPRRNTPKPDNENRLIFQMMHGSFGTVGILSKLTFKLVPAKPYVKVRYERHNDIDAYVEGIRRHMSAEDMDFMDGILFSPGELMLSLGTFVDRAPYTHSYYWVKPYFETTRERTEDYLKTPDYFWRYDIGVTNPTPRSPVACRAAMGVPSAAPAGSRARTNSTGGISAEPVKAR